MVPVQRCDEITKVPADDGEPLSLTSEKVCDDNPCDPRRSKLLWNWSADPVGSIDKANKGAATKEPCTHGSQCHQNQKRQDPSQGSCSHDTSNNGV